MAHGVRVPPGIEARGGCSVRSITGSGVRGGVTEDSVHAALGGGTGCACSARQRAGPARGRGRRARALATAGSKETAEAHQGVARWRHDRGEPGHQLHRVHARAFDKVLAKSIVRAADGRVADSIVLPPDDVIAARAAIEEVVSKHGRAVVKPVADGSSVGLFHVESIARAREVAEEVASRSVAYLCEAFVSGPELTVGVAQGDDGVARVLCASEVRLAPGRVFDFAGKYLGKGTIELTPAEQPEAVVRAAEALALLAHNALGCEGYTRTDAIVSERGAVFLETNTLPGLTKASFIPQQVAARAMKLEDFLRTQIQLAIARRDRAVRERAQT